MPFGLHGVGYGAKWAARPVTEKATRYFGKRKLAKQLAKGSDFEDVNLGYIDDELATRLNQVRNAENVSPVGNAGVTVPAKNVAHIFNRRIIKNKYTPQEAGETINNALFSRDSRVIRGKTPDYQVVLDTNDIPNAAIVGRNPNTNGIMVKTGYRADNVSGLSESYKGGNLAGTGNPASTPIQQNRSAASISTLQVPSYINNIAQDMSEVNPAFKRSFVEALADENKRRTMRNAVISGAEDLSERAKILADRLERRSSGMYDADFEQVIKTPELKRAEEKYAGFMAKNGGQMMPEEKVADFYAQHPIAEGIIAEMRLIDPRAFDGIQPGSLAEFDMLNKTLREEAGNKVKVGASRSGALKRAENDMKTLMDREFPGFRDVNRNFADAQTTQDIFESRLKKGLTSVGGATVSPFWSGISSPLTAAGVVGGYFNPFSLAVTAGGLGGKALMRSMRRNAGRRLADGTVRTPIEVNINPAFAAGLSSAAFNNLRNR